MTPILAVTDLEAAYGASVALRGVSIEVGEGEMVGVLGVNGAGKSTLLKVIAGLLRPTRGSVQLRGEPLAGRSPEWIVRKGIALVPEGRHVFPSLTVAENLRLGAATRRDRVEIQGDLEEMFRMFPILRERREQLSGTLSGGEQQQLANARALMSRPALIMLDEPSLGLAPILVDEMFTMIQALRGRGVTVLVIEQNVRRTLAIVDRVYLMNNGLIEFAGRPGDLLEQADIERAYLGGADET